MQHRDGSEQPTVELPINEQNTAAPDADDRKRKECLVKCGALLSRRDYSCARLREKLLAGGFSAETADWALERLREAHYVDDERYARNFISAHREDKSRMRMRADLEARGIPSDLAAEALREEYEENGEEAEIRQIRKLMAKRKFDPEQADWEEKRKMQAFLYRKGYSASSVRTAMRGEEY